MTKEKEIWLIESSVTMVEGDVIGYIDFGQAYSSSGGDFTIEWDSEGILYLGE